MPDQSEIDRQAAHQKDIENAKQRFSGFRYSFKGVANEYILDIIPQLPGLYAFPTGDEWRQGEEELLASDSSEE